MTEEYVFEMTLDVRDYEVDYEGIVNNANYIHYMEHTRHQWCQQAGFSFKDMHQQGIDPVVRRLQVEYLRPLRLGDQMLSCLRIERQGALWVFHQDIYHLPSRQLATRAQVGIACVTDGRLTRGEEFAAVFGPYLANGR